MLAACEMLGLDPLYIANEGKLVAIVPPEDADKVLAAMSVKVRQERGHHRRGQSPSTPGGW